MSPKILRMRFLAEERVIAPAACLVLVAAGRCSLHRARFVDGPNPEQENEERADRKDHFVTGHSLTENRQNTAAEDDKNDTQAAEEPAHWLSPG